MNLQTRYDLEVAEDKIADKVDRDVRPSTQRTLTGCSLIPRGALYPLIARTTPQEQGDATDH